MRCKIILVRKSLIVNVDKSYFHSTKIIFDTEPLVFEMMAHHWFAQSLIEMNTKQMNQTQINPVITDPVEVRLCI